MSGLPKARHIMGNDPEEIRVLKACAKGDWKEFGYIFDKYKDRVYFLALGIVKNRALAKDVAQNSFVKVFKSLKWFNHQSDFSTWIFRITYNQAIDQYRKHRRKGDSELAGEITSGTLGTAKDELFQNIADRELQGKLAEALDSLPIKLRSAVVLKYMEGFTYTEICNIVGCARGVLQKRLNQANKILREILGKQI